MPTDWAERYAAIHALIRDPEKLVPGSIVLPHWIDAHTFWYTRDLSDDTVVCIIDARDAAADLRVSLKLITASIQQAKNPSVLIPSDDVVPVDATRETVTVKLDRAFWIYDITQGVAKIRQDGTRPGDQISIAPDGMTRIVLRDSNLVLLRDGEECALTSDGEEANAYASVPLAKRPFELLVASAPQGMWSPDGRYFFTLRVDERLVGSLPIMEFLPAHGTRPQVRTNRTSLPGDEHVTEFTMVMVDLEGGVAEIDHPPLPSVRMNDTPFSGGMAWWSADSRTAYFIAIQRGEFKVSVIACDAATGKTRVVFSEEADAPIDLSVNVYTPALVEFLPSRNQLVWYSERSGRGQFYLYDLINGHLVKQITDGDWHIRELLGTDDDESTLFFLAGGIGSASTPYQVRPCSVRLDEGPASVRVLLDDDGDHLVYRAGDWSSSASAPFHTPLASIAGLAPGAGYLVDTISYLDRLPRTVLIDREGVMIRELESGDSSALPKGWRWPIPVRTTAADGTTYVYGVLFTPHNYDPNGNYPVIDAIYGGPQVHIVPSGAFADGASMLRLIEAMALSELGAFTLILDGRGTTERDREFHHTSWRKIHEASNIDDHIAAIRQLHATYPAMDLNRVGITGFSAGGYATALASFQHGDFFKVAVAGGGNYDQSLFWHTWGERYHGLYEEDHYATQAAKTYAAQASGKILFIHGLRDFGCHPASLFQVLQKMIEHGKDYDLVLLPAAGHALGGYGERRRLDYFVTHLFGGVPPVLTRPFTLAGDEKYKELFESGPSIAENAVVQ